MQRKRLTFWIDAPQSDALKAIKRRDGIPEAEQIRRALAWWIEQKGLASGSAKAPRKRAR